MWKRILYLVVFVSVVNGGRFLSHLYGQKKQNYMLICLKASGARRERSCSGALLNNNVVGVSAGCLRQHPQEHMIALRQTFGERCKDITDSYSTIHARGVWDHLYHPWMDLALVLLDRPYYQLDLHPNSTLYTVSRAFRKHGQWKWMKQYMKVAALERDLIHNYQKLAIGMVSMRSPILISFLAIVVPIMIFLLLSYVVLNSKSTKEPLCDSIDYDKANL